MSEGRYETDKLRHKVKLCSRVMRQEKSDVIRLHLARPDDCHRQPY